MTVLQKLLDPHTYNVLLTLATSPEPIHLREIVVRSKSNPATVFRIINKLVEQGVVRRHKVHKFKLYELALAIPELKADPLTAFISAISRIEGIKQIILQGKDEPDKASLIIVGSLIDELVIEQEKRKLEHFSIAHIILTENQYDQMVAMGLYSGKKKVLFSR
ncbi:MAG: helix-turn-helix domain-containing protein [Candidatus Woesearchaeota archaeon]|nr:MAG: helix-turn-helix domain-containing protein [Candidatus Woesearchaeota archaeon]